MKIKFWKKREVWCPTRWGWLVILAVFLGVPGWWWCNGEEFLSVTKTVPPDVLVVEGWIGTSAASAAVAEFRRGGYRYIVAAGLPPEDWMPNDEYWDYAEVAAKDLLAAGVDPALIIEAPGRATERHRTWETASGVRRGLESSGIETTTLTVFTKGPHARRSLRIFEEVFGPDVEVGVIGWMPERYEGKAWRTSSTRAKNFAEESLGYLHELLFRSGRGDQHQDEAQ